MVQPRDAHEPMATREPSEAGTDSRPGKRRGTPPDRLRTVWQSLPGERRLAALAALGLVVTLFLPWYQETVIAQGTSARLNTLSASLTGWGAFSFVEAAVLLVAAAVIVLIFVRAEGAAFHVPGGDGGVVTAAGAWACLLIVWRMFDKQGTTAHGLYETASGIEWGIFVALAVAALLTYAGSRIRLAHEPEPPLPGEGAAPERRPQPAATTAGTAAATPPEPPARQRRSSPRPPPVAPNPPRRRRVRPSSLADPAPDSAPADDRTEVMRGPVKPEHPTGAQRERSDRGLDFTELEQISLDDPPEAPTIRRRDPDPEDPLTTRLDRAD